MKTVYISGPITDQKSGQPREGWQKGFLDAEARLRAMGFQVINPVDIAREVEESFAWRWEYVPHHCASDGPVRPDRADYIMACLQRMKLNHTFGHLDAVYVIGDNVACYESRGVQMELSLAEVLGVPIYAECRTDCRVDHNIVALPGEGGIEELLKEDWRCQEGKKQK